MSERNLILNGTISDQELNYLGVFRKQTPYISNLIQDIHLDNLQSTSEANFKVEVSAVGTSFRLNLYRDTFEGFRGGLNAARRHLLSQEIRTAELVETVGFSTRGVIEGFYGKPWTSDERLEILEFLAIHDFNLFIVAPKDDAWQRFNWREPFTTKKIQEFTELNLKAQQLGIDLALCVSPGLSISYASEADLAAIMKRMHQLVKVGIKTFGLLLDDIPPTLMNAQDKTIFSETVEAHAFLANAVNQELKKLNSNAVLILCPMQYHGRGNEHYINTLCKGLASDIEVFWTGRQICSEYLEISDAKVFKSATGKKPFYWDNYPVNDVAMVHQLHVGPIENRESGLYMHSAGYAANPMDRIESSKFALATIGEYLVNPENYNAAVAWGNYLWDTFAVIDEREAIRFFLNCCFESCLSVDPAPEFNEWLMQVSFAWHTHNIESAAQLFNQMGNRIIQASEILESPDFSHKKLQHEVLVWLKKFRNTGLSLLKVAHALAKIEVDGNENLIFNSDLADFIQNEKEFLASDPTRIFGDGLDMMLGELVTELAVSD